MTLSDLTNSAQQTAKELWYEARKAYYAAEKAAGRAISDIRQGMPKTLKSLQAFTAESAKGHRYLEENSAKARENIRKLTD